MIKSLTIFSFLLLLFSSLAWAATEDDIIKSVIRHFPLIEESKLKVKAAEGEIEASKGAFDHKLQFKSRNRIEDTYDNNYFETSIERRTPYYGLGLIAGHRQGIGTFPAYDGKYETSGAGEIFAGITLPILRNFKTDPSRTQLSISQIGKKLAEAELSLKKNIHIHQALSLYYKWLFYNQKIKIREEVLKIAMDRQEMLEKKFKAGDIEKLKLTDNQRSMAKRRDELTKAKIERQKAVNELSLYWRDQLGAPVVPGNEILPSEDVKEVSVASPSFSEIPQILQIESELKILKERRKLYQQSRLPGLNVDVIGAKELSNNQPYDPDYMQIGVKLDFPLENRKAEGKTVASEYKFLAAQKEKQYLLDKLEQEFNNSLQALKLSQERWRLTNQEFKRSKDLALAEKSRWLQGASDLYIVNLREQDLAESDIKRWSTWLEYHLYHLDARLYSARLVPKNQ